MIYSQVDGRGAYKGVTQNEREQLEIDDPAATNNPGFTWNIMLLIGIINDVSS